MIFRNVTMFRFPASLSLEGLDEALTRAALKPVGPMELSSRGFIPPFADEADILVRHAGNALWVALGGQDRLLPMAVVNDLLGKKIADYEAKNGRKPGGRMRRQMKEDLIVELIPRAFVRPMRTDALIDLERRVVAVATSSRRAAEAVISHLREAVGSFPALPLSAELAPRAVLTGWIAGDPLPRDLALGEECEVRDAVSSGSVVKLQRMELAGEEIATHLEAGKQAVRLGLTLGDRVSFVLGEDLILRKLKLLDGAVDQLESTEREDWRAEVDARITLMAGEFARVFDALDKALKISEAG